MRKPLINENFFSDWSHEMSYILGFSVADGSIYKRRDRKDSFIFNITNKDYCILENIKRAMGAGYRIGTKASGYTGKKDYYYLQISNKQVCKDLLSLGIRPRKTYRLDPIRVPNEYFPDFTRGFFDGDGTVYIYEVNKTPQIKAEFISTSLPFLKELNQRLCRNLRIPPKSIHRESIKGKMTMYGICFYIDDCERLANFMYDRNSSLYLRRKRQIFEKWKSIKRRRYFKQNYPSKIGWHLNQKLYA